MAASIVTPEDLAAMENRLASLINSRSQPPDAAWLTIQQAAERVQHSEKTVSRWITKGKRGMDGQTRRLNTYKFTESDRRILLADLIEFGKIK